jgi:antitoxin component YwqK of YwqJK toxin-antitoxin module
MSNIFKLKIALCTLLFFAITGNRVAAQTLPSDSTALIILDTLRVVYIYADTGKALNRFDKFGHKQGLWEQKYTNGNIRYKGHFKDDKPIGVFKYFYESNDSLRILAVYSENGKVARAHEYYFTGAMASEGKYVNQQKDSVWKLFDDVQKLRAKDQYANGKKEGKSLMFYPDGNVLESKMWHNDLENGTWQQFFEDGTLKVEGTYVDGKLEGPASFYNAEGHLEIKGNYHNDVKDGRWIYYNDSNQAKDSLIYKNGRVLEPRKFILTPAQLDSMKRAHEEENQDRPKNIGEDDYGN